MVFLTSCAAEVQILVVYPQLVEGVGTVGVVLQEWTTKQPNASQGVENNLAGLVSRKCSISMSSLMSSLRKSLLSPEEFGIPNEILLCRREDLMGDRFRY